MAACAQTQFVVTVANIGVGAVLAVLLGMGGGVQFDAKVRDYWEAPESSS